ncbi:type II and III secretion system protein family protein [Novosphingobium umbonatum]|nr:type II and III secretion system protein family protein [Novosphingobium umbonatum]
MTRCLSTLLAVSSLAMAAQALAAAPAKHKPAARMPLVTKSMASKAPANQPVFNPATSAVAITRPSGEVLLSIGRGQLITLPSAMKDVFIADDKVADVQVKSKSQLYIFGRSAGETTLYASNATGQIIWSATLRVASNIDSVDQMLRVAMPDARITVSTVSAGTVLLTGMVGAPEDAAEAQRLVQAYLGKDSNVITRLKTATPLQVNLQVRIAEVSRSMTKVLGTNLTAVSSNSGGVLFGVARGNNQGTITNPQGVVLSDAATGTITKAPTIYNMAGNLANSTAIGIGAKVLGMTLLGSLDAGEQMGLVTTLAQPNLTALSGETGEFLAGGEFPIPISSGLGTVSVEYKRYGVSLSYTPTVLADGRISLRVRPEVSELSSDGAVTLNGYTIPALTTRRAETSVELGSGQSLMIGGLLSNKANNTIQKMPGVGDIPMLGSLFKSTNFQRGETELVIVITPYLVKPVNDGEIKLPTDGFQNPDDIQRIWGNQVSDGVTGGSRALPSVAPEKVEPKAAPVKVGLSDPKSAPNAAAPGFSLN